MSDLSYTPTFFHKPWTDNVSRITAGGEDGFNVRFAAIESDLHQVSTVVDKIALEIVTRRLSVPLDLVGPNAFATVDLASFRYFLVANATQVTDSDAISLAAVQLFYTV